MMMNTVMSWVQSSCWMCCAACYRLPGVALEGSLSFSCGPCGLLTPESPWVQTSLLDALRSTSVASGEAGGITQVC